MQRREKEKIRMKERREKDKIKNEIKKKERNHEI